MFVWGHYLLSRSISDPFLSPKRIGFGSRFWTVGLYHTSHITYHHEHPEHQQHQEHQPLSDQAGERGEDGTAVYAGEVRLRHGGSVCP